MCRPSAAVSSAVQVEDGDLIVLASDGLFNNMYKSELTELLKDFKVPHVVLAWFMVTKEVLLLRVLA